MPKRSIPAQRGFFPQPAYLIGTYKDNGKPNFALVTWVTFCSADPPMIMFVFRGKKASRELVERNRVFTLNLVTTEMMGMADYFGARSGYTIDKCKEVKANYSNGRAVNAPILDMSPWVYECQLADTKQVGDSTIYIGEIMVTTVDDKIKSTAYGKVDLLDIDPVIYAPGGYYKLDGRIGNVGEVQKKLK